MTTIARPCSIADTLGVIGEKYSLLVLREIFFGVRRDGSQRTHERQSESQRRRSKALGHFFSRK